MPPARHTLRHYQGDSFRRSFRFRLPDGSYENLTGQVGRAQVRRKGADPLLVEFTVTVEDQADPETVGMVTLRLSPEQSAQLPPGDMVWDLQLASEDGIEVTTRIAGKFTVDDEVTR